MCSQHDQVSLHVELLRLAVVPTDHAARAEGAMVPMPDGRDLAPGKNLQASQELGVARATLVTNLRYAASAFISARSPLTTAMCIAVA